MSRDKLRGRTTTIEDSCSAVTKLSDQTLIIILLVAFSLSMNTASAQQNLLWNGNFDRSEATDPDHSFRKWTNGYPSYSLTRSTTGSDAGNWHYATLSSDRETTVYQELDLTNPYYGLDQTRLANGGYMAEFGGLQKSYIEWGFSPIDAGLISFSGDEYSTDLGWQNSTLWWTTSSGTSQILNSSPVRYSFTAKRFDNHEPQHLNDAWLDNAYVYVKENHIWSTGAPYGDNLYGQGDRVMVNDWDLPGRLYITNGATLTTQGTVYGSSSEVNIQNGQWQAVAGVWLRDSTINVTNGLWSTTEEPVYVGTLGESSVTIGDGGVWICTSPTQLGKGQGSDGSHGTVNVAGGLWTVDSDLEIGAGRTGNVTVTNGGTWGTNHTVKVGGSWEWAPQTIARGTGHVNIGDNVFGNNEYWVTEGPVSVGGEGTGTVNLHGSGEWQSRNSVTVGGLYPGSVALRGGTWRASDTVHVQSNGTISILDGTLHVEPDTILSVDGNLTFNGGAIELHNDGSSLVTTSHDLMLNGAEIFGDGVVQVTGHRIDLGSLSNPGRLTGYGPGHELEAYANISGSGTLEHVNLSGNISVGSSAGRLTLSHVAMIAGSRIELGVEGIGDDDFDQLILGQGVSLNGIVIDIVLADDFQPTGVTEYQMISAIDGAVLYNALSGASIILPDLCEFNTNTGVLTVIPEPAMAVLMLVGGTALLSKRRRARR